MFPERVRPLGVRPAYPPFGVHYYKAVGVGGGDIGGHVLRALETTSRGLPVYGLVCP